MRAEINETTETKESKPSDILEAIEPNEQLNS